MILVSDGVAEIVREISRPLWLPVSYVVAHAHIESSFDTTIVGTDGTGSIGLMQVEPATAKQMGGGDQRIPWNSLSTGILYIIWLHGYLSGHGFDCVDYAGTIAEAYNEGPNNRVRGRRDPDYNEKWRIAQNIYAYLDKVS